MTLLLKHCSCGGEAESDMGQVDQDQIPDEIKLMSAEVKNGFVYPPVDLRKHFIRCRSCHKTTDIFETKEAATENWNSKVSKI